jgi:hypothetical protein
MMVEEEETEEQFQETNPKGKNIAQERIPKEYEQEEENATDTVAQRQDRLENSLNTIMKMITTISGNIQEGSSRKSQNFRSNQQ